MRILPALPPDAERDASPAMRRHDGSIEGHRRERRRRWVHAQALALDRVLSPAARRRGRH